MFEKVMKSPSEKAKTKLVTDSIVNVTADNRINKNYASKERVLCSNCGREMTLLIRLLVMLVLRLKKRIYLLFH